MSGIAPNVEIDDRRARCAQCGTLLRYWPANDQPLEQATPDRGGVWRHAALGFDHAPEPLTRPNGVPDDAPMTETELRALWGDR